MTPTGGLERNLPIYLSSPVRGAQTGCSVIFVTHDIQEAILLADKLILLSKRPGKILNMQTVSAIKPRSREFLQSEEFIRFHEALLDQFPT